MNMRLFRWKYLPGLSTLGKTLWPVCSFDPPIPTFSFRTCQMQLFTQRNSLSNCYDEVTSVHCLEKLNQLILKADILFAGSTILRMC